MGDLVIFTGDYPSRPVVQGITREEPFVRLKDGRLAVYGEPGVHVAPVPPAEGPTRGDKDQRPGPLRAEPSRITTALNLRSMDGPLVDEALGVLLPDGRDVVVDLWEEGKVVPTEDEVRRLATLTGMPVAWFYQDPVPAVDGFVCCRR